MNPKELEKRINEIQRIKNRRDKEIRTIITTSIYDILTNKPYCKLRPNEKDKKIIRTAINRDVSEHKEVQLQGFWGLGLSKCITGPEIETINFLCEMDKEVKTVYEPGIKYNWILADEHAKLNGLYNEYESYNKISSLKNNFRELGMNFSINSLTNIWRENNISREVIEEIISNKKPNWWDDIPNKEIYEQGANKVGGNAWRYYIARELERNKINPDKQIFHSFGHAKTKDVLPEGTLLLYKKKGQTGSPWFKV